MVAFRNYLISVTAAAMIAGIVIALTKKNGSISSIIKLLSGLFVAITILHPIVDLPLNDLQLRLDHVSFDSKEAVAYGKKAADEEMMQIITERSCAYIQEKANSLGADLQIEVFLQDLIPSSVQITGAVSPYAKLRLSQYIANELGISLEDQLWIG